MTERKEIMLVHPDPDAAPSLSVGARVKSVRGTHKGRVGLVERVGAYYVHVRFEGLEGLKKKGVATLHVVSDVDDLAALEQRLGMLKLEAEKLYAELSELERRVEVARA